MSMSLTVITVSDSDIHDILEQPLRLEVLLAGDEDKEAIFEDLFGDEDIDEDVEAAVRSWTPVTTDLRPCYLEGSFQALHYLLTQKPDRQGTTYPLNFLRSPRHPGMEQGWEPASLFSAAEVREISAALDELDPADLRIRYDPDAYNALKIYPGRTAWKPEDENHLLDRFDELRTFMAQAAKENCGVCLTLL